MLAKFTTPYYQLFQVSDDVTAATCPSVCSISSNPPLSQRVDALLSQPASAPLPPGCTTPDLARALHLLLELYLDFNAQDLPEFFEDHLGVFLGAGEGVQVQPGAGGPVGEGAEYGFVGKYLRWSRADLMGEVGPARRTAWFGRATPLTHWHRPPARPPGGRRRPGPTPARQGDRVRDCRALRAQVLGRLSAARRVCAWRVGDARKRRAGHAG